MAIKNITYTDKVDLNETEVADINKVKASDLNEIKTVVNNNATEMVETYSTTETKINKIWIDGKPIYRKVLTLSSLPNTQTLNIDISSLNVATIISLVGYSNTGLVFNGTRTPTSSQIDMYADITRNQIDLTTYQDRTNMSGFIIIEYTKTS